MYTAVLVLHSLLRWVVLALGVLALVRAFGGWFGRRPWTAADKKVGLFFMISVDVQVLLGLLLYFVLSPITRAAFAQFGAAMKVKELRFWAVEHIMLMVLAVVAVHVARVLSKRATDDTARHRRVAIGFAVAMLLMLAAIPWPWMAVARPLFRLS
jgi:hypothetical protein